MQLQALKRMALDQKHLLERYVDLYDSFQKYVESLTPYLNGKSAETEMLVAMERFRLLFAEYEAVFLEWEDGMQVVNRGIAAFLEGPDEFRNNEAGFRLMLTLATTKFEDILKKAGRDLRELHERVALEEGQSKAEEVTHVSSSALAKVKDADVVAEIATKWLGRAVKFAPWVYEVLKNLHP